MYCQKKCFIPIAGISDRCKEWKPIHGKWIPNSLLHPEDDEIVTVIIARPTEPGKFYYSFSIDRWKDGKWSITDEQESDERIVFWSRHDDEPSWAEMQREFKKAVCIE